MPAAVTKARIPTALGESIPAHSVHGISVSLPTWQDNIAYEEGHPRVIDKIRSAYPRFKIHHLIEKLEAFCERKFGAPGEKCHLYPSLKLAQLCRTHMHDHSPDKTHPVDVRLAQFWIHPPEATPGSTSTSTRPSVELHIVFFPREADPLARTFWQHTGTGISSRVAEYCLSLLARQGPASSAKPSAEDSLPSPPASPAPTKPHNRHYSSLKKGAAAVIPTPTTAKDPDPELDEVDENSPDWARYIEERFARNQPVSEAPNAKRQLRRRIAGVLLKDQTQTHTENVLPEEPKQGQGPTEEDVFLFPSGMSAIWHAHRTVLESFTPTKSVCFGFPYTDTLKILQKWGPGCHFFGNGVESDLVELTEILKSSRDAGTPIHALFCEFPSNPLLRTPPLLKLRQLADEYDFLIVVDETIGSFANVEILPLADIIVSSLSKVFSGETNVLGGSLVLNPQSRHYKTLKTSIDAVYEDTYWIEDAVFMERNSRDFAPRVRKMNQTTRALAEYLRSRSLAGRRDAPNDGKADETLVINEVYYPLWMTRENYDACRIGSPQQIARSGSRHGKDKDWPLGAEGGYGMLFTVTFTSEFASEIFYDALPIEKGPSLGTNFTLASPYAILAHYNELDWAAQFGVERGLVRVSVGLEDEEELLGWFKDAVTKTEEAVRARVATNA